MNKKNIISEATREQIQRSRESIIKEHGRPMPRAIVVKCFACIEKYGQGNPCRCGVAVPLHIPFPEKHERFVKNLFKLVGK